MINKPSHIAHLITLFLQDKLSEAEEIEFNNWLTQNKLNEELLSEFKDSAQIKKDLTFVNSLNANAAWNKMTKKVNRYHDPLWLKIAAVLFLLLGSVIWFYSGQIQNDNVTLVQKNKGEHILPAQSGAVLVLSDGKNISLNKDKANYLGENLKLVDNANELRYTNSEKHSNTLEYNTLVVPKASFFKITLSDGTKVWVNAMSQLRFPIMFGKAERRVQLTGEAYFEVTKDQSRPFYIESNNTSIKVLGTHFNVNAYNPQTKTTLVEGRVEVKSGREKVEINSGQFATVNHDKIIKGEADIQRDLAWRQNEFYFKADNIKSISEQLARWYNLEIKFEGEIPLNKEFNGTIERDVKLSEVLAMLEFVSDLKFSVEGRKLIIQNKK